MKWYYINEENAVIGPVSETALRQLKACGEIKNETRICREGTEDWITSEELPDPAMATANIPELFKFNCPHCSQHIEAEVSHVGMEAECPACRRKMVVQQFPTNNSGKIKVINHARPKVIIFSILGLVGILAVGSFVLLNKNKSRRIHPINQETESSASSVEDQDEGKSEPKEYSFSAGILPELSRPVPDGFVLIPEGSFTMGDTLDGMEDAPPHEVYLSSFYMGRHEVTRGLWKSVIKWGQENNYQSLPKATRDTESAGENAQEKENYPAYWIGWYDILKWCNAYSEMEGLRPCYFLNGEIIRGDTILESKNAFLITCDFSSNGFRLPTEAEWEKAARGGRHGLRFPWGNEISHERANYTNYILNSIGSKVGDRHDKAGSVPPFHLPVGSFPPNDYGLYDMSGNVAEWCWDAYERDFYYDSPKLKSYYPNFFNESPRLNPVGPPVQVENFSNQAWRQRVYRGGCGEFSAEECRVFVRECEFTLKNGFRLVCR